MRRLCGYLFLGFFVWGFVFVALGCATNEPTYLIPAGIGWVVALFLGRISDRGVGASDRRMARSIRRRARLQRLLLLLPVSFFLRRLAEGGHWEFNGQDGVWRRVQVCSRRRADPFASLGLDCCEDWGD